MSNKDFLSSKSLSCNDIEQIKNNLKTTEALAFVDGSYSDATTKKAGAGVVLFVVGKELHIAADVDNKFHPGKSVAAELVAATEAVNLAKQIGVNRLFLCYDYDGILKFTTDEWTTKKDYIRTYRDFMKKASKDIDIVFIKKAESEVWDEYHSWADNLAKSVVFA